MPTPLRRVVLRGNVAVALPPEEALRLFTPQGERAWGHGWDPVFPAGDDGDAMAGTVFRTAAHDAETLWVVAGRTSRSISYARVTPGDRAGTVTVTCERDGAGTRAEVAYDLTALAPDAQPALDAFAAGYAEFLESWERAIAGQGAA
jgi:hypothetical protein